MIKDIVYFIFSVGKANGGHYRSLVATAEAMSKEHKVKIVVLGYTYSHIIKSSAVESEFIYFNGLNVFSAFNKAKRAVSNNSILHAFDTYSFFIVRLLGYKLNDKIALTKCGGVNPRGFFPAVDNIVLFSKENYDFFNTHNKWEHTYIELIPNRTDNFESDYSKIKSLKSKLGLDNYDKVVLRISRINQFYFNTIEQSINLQKFLLDNNQNSALLIVGNVQDEEIYNKLALTATKNVFFVRDDTYTKNAREIIDIADWVIGTGRGFMEASSKAKVMFATSPTEEIPMLITGDNFETALEYNFSGRTKFSDEQLAVNKSNIAEIINNTVVEDSTKQQSLVWFDIYFSIDNLIVKYNRFYDNLKETEFSKFDILKHWIYFIKNNLGTWYRLIFKKNDK